MFFKINYFCYYFLLNAPVHDRRLLTTLFTITPSPRSSAQIHILYISFLKKKESVIKISEQMAFKIKLHKILSFWCESKLKSTRIRGFGYFKIPSWFWRDSGPESDTRSGCVLILNTHLDPDPNPSTELFCTLNRIQTQRNPYYDEYFLGVSDLILENLAESGNGFEIVCDPDLKFLKIYRPKS